MITLLDRTVGRAVLLRTGAALLLATALLLLADLLGRVGALPEIVARDGGWAALAQAYWLRVPEMAAMALPVAPALAAMITLLGMHRAGQLTALGAAGIGPRRVLRPAMAVALLCGAGAWYAADRLLPGLTAAREQADVRMSSGDASGGLGRTRKVGWKTAEAQWAAFRAQPALGTYHELTAWNRRNDDLIHARLMDWDGTRWRLHECRLVRGSDVRFFARIAPQELGLPPPPPPPELAMAFRAMHQVPGPELPLAHRLGRAALLKRIGIGLLPLLVLALAVPFLVRRLTRGTPGRSAIQALGIGAIPIVVLGLMDKALMTTRLDVTVLALATMTPQIAWAAWAWLRLRL